MMSVDLANRSTHSTLVDRVGELANEYAGGHVFSDYLRRRAANTIRSQSYDLVTFSEYLSHCLIDVDPDALQSNPQAWEFLTWGLVAGYLDWLLEKGFSIGTINRRLSTVRVYARLGALAGYVAQAEYDRLSLVRGFSAKDGANADEQRSIVRRGSKKAEPIQLSDSDVRLLKDQNLSKSQGVRDSLLMCLMLDHGLRLGEVAILRGDNVFIEERRMLFFRPKVSIDQWLIFTDDTLRALESYQSYIIPGEKLIRRSVSRNALSDGFMSGRGIAKRVRVLGERIGIDSLSPHDLRHSWATRAARGGSDAFALRDAGGWSSLSMPSRYVAAGEISNARIVLA